MEAAFLTQQVLRLRWLNYFPAGQQDRTAYTSELAKPLANAADESIVIAVIDEWMATNPDRPTPADFYAAVKRLNPPSQPVPSWRTGRGVCGDDWKAAGLSSDDFDAWLADPMQPVPEPVLAAAAQRSDLPGTKC
jgi:hypothetical protein